MADGITIQTHGDYGPFSTMGKSIGYQVTIRKSSYLVDCGSPVFQQIGIHKIENIKGLLVTHCHDDHKRWFTDLALFYRYTFGVPQRIFFLTSERVNEEISRASGPALDKSLSYDSKSVIDIAYGEYVDYRMIGPQAKYRIVAKNEGEGRLRFFVLDRDGNPVTPDRAKIVISRKTGMPRMLFKDPDYQEWVEPESFYPFSSQVFYEQDRNIFRDPEGFTIEAINAPVWHGIPGIGLKFKTDKESLIFSSDTVHDVEIWKQLYSEKRRQQTPLSKKEFDAAPVLYGDINDYLERVWSEERYLEAINTFHNSIVIHDIAVKKSIVHTDYMGLKNTVLRKDKTILTHSPDTITSQWVLNNAGKRFKIEGDTFCEIVGNKPYPCNADVYHKEAGKYYVGYKNGKGNYTVYEKDGILCLSRGDRSDLGTPLYRVDLYEDVSGRYFPKLEDTSATYLERKDGRVELVKFTDTGSVGRIEENRRDSFSKVADEYF